MKSLSLYFIVTLVTCMTPGAGVLCTLTSALRYGMRLAAMAPTGNALGCLVVAVLSAAGIGGIIQANPVIFNAMQCAGALVLAYLGWRSWKAPAAALLEAVGTRGGEPGSAWTPFLNSFLLQGTNPMLYVFVLSLLPQFISPEGSYVRQSAVLIAIFIATCWGVHIVYSLTAAWARRYLNARFSRILNRTSALLFWLLAASVLWTTFGPAA